LEALKNESSNELPSKRFSRRIEDFVCEVCGTHVKGNGYTDHCPNCLSSKHVDINPGDRKSDCGGIMVPVRTEYAKHEFFIYYRCTKCGAEKRVKAAKDDNKELLMELLPR